ncbi:MAG: AmmeMemoRadiSam system protein B [bacterium]
MKECVLLIFMISFILSIVSSSHAASDGPLEEVRIRRPVVADQFYPGSEKKLSKMIDDFSKNATGNTINGRIYGLVSPHAGYIYSGIVAAAGFRQIDSKMKRVFVLAPSHNYGVGKASILDVDYYQTPLGDIPLSEIAAKLREKAIFSPIPHMHQYEHSLEVQLPFLQKQLEKFELIPIVMGHVDPKEVADALLPYIDENTLIVASSDLSHYKDYDQAKKLDHACIETILHFDFSRMGSCEACGIGPVTVLTRIAKAKGWSSKLIDYKNSGDTAGPRDKVVGYASIAFYAEEKMNKETEKDEAVSDTGLSLEHKKLLLQLARVTITKKLNPDAALSLPTDIPSKLMEKQGCFVTLHKKGQLRGCIGTILPLDPLYDSVKKNAINSAFGDPRFPALRKDELADIEIEISVLTIPQQVHFTDGEDLKRQLRPNIDGVILRQGMASSTFLPQVWEQLPDKEEFLGHLCQKGGMNHHCWKNPETKVEIYQAIVFSEAEVK